MKDYPKYVEEAKKVRSRNLAIATLLNNTPCSLVCLSACLSVSCL
jgi:CHAT domain-containing protein